MPLYKDPSCLYVGAQGNIVRYEGPDGEHLKVMRDLIETAETYYADVDYFTLNFRGTIISNTTFLCMASPYISAETFEACSVESALREMKIFAEILMASLPLYHEEDLRHDA